MSTLVLVSAIHCRLCPHFLPEGQACAMANGDLISRLLPLRCPTRGTSSTFDSRTPAILLDSEGVIRNLTPSAALPLADPWGPPMWVEIHARPLLFAASGDVAGELAFLESLKGRLPCGECRQDYTTYLATIPPDLSSAAAYARWGWGLHEHVNGKLGKTGLSFERAAAANAWPVEERSTP